MNSSSLDDAEHRTSTLNRLRPLHGSSKPMQCLAASAGLEFGSSLPRWGLLEQWRRHFARADSLLGCAGNRTERGERYMRSSVNSLSGIPALRDRVREAYWKRRDPIIEDRVLWRAQTPPPRVLVLPL